MLCVVTMQFSFEQTVSADQFRGKYVCTDRNGYDYYLERTLSFTDDPAVFPIGSKRITGYDSFFTYVQKYKGKKMVRRDVYTFSESEDGWIWETDSDKVPKVVERNSVEEAILMLARKYVGM